MGGLWHCCTHIDGEINEQYIYEGAIVHCHDFVTWDVIGAGSLDMPMEIFDVYGDVNLIEDTDLETVGGFGWKQCDNSMV